VVGRVIVIPCWKCSFLMHPMPSGLGLHSENVALAHPKVKKWLKRYYPPPPPCVYQYLMNIIQLQCNFSAVVTKKMFISVHISRVFPLYLFKCKRNYLNNVWSIYSLWWSVHKYFSNGTLTDSQVLLPMDHEHDQDHPWSSLAIGLP